MNDLAPNYLSNLFAKNSARDIIRLRNTDIDLYVPCMDTKNGQKASFHRSVHVCKKFQLTPKQTCSQSNFRRAVKI